MDKSAKQDEIFHFGENLLNCMNNVCKTPITLMSAPVGYGKTTALREFFRRTNTNYRIIFLGPDCSMEAFWDAARDALSFCVAGGGQNLLPEKFPLEARSVSEALMAISQANFSRKSVIIFDDFHNVTFPNAYAFLTALAKMAIPNLHLVVSSRSAFTDISGLLLSGCANIITTRAFILSEDDIAKIFSAHGVLLSRKQAGALYYYTEGWPALIHNILMSVTLAGKIDRQSISVFENNIVRSLTETAYCPLPGECKDLLLRLCGEKNFTEEQAAFVCGGGEDYAAGGFPLRSALDKIKDLNVFVLNGLAEDKTEYKVHNFFAKAILSQIALLPEDKRAEFQKKMGDWFFLKARYRQAAGYYRAAGDAASFFKAYERMKLCRGLPDAFLMLLAFYMRESENMPSYNALGRLTFAVEMYLHGAPDVFREIVGQSAVVPKNLRLRTERLDAEMELVLCATDECDAEKNAVRVERALCLTGNGKEKLNDKIDFAYANPFILFLYHKTAGSLDQTVETFERLNGGYRLLTGAGDSGAAALMKAEAKYCRGDFVQAEETLQDSLLNSLRLREFCVWTAGQFLMARLRLVRGSFDEAFTTMEATRDLLVLEGEQYLENTVDLCESFLYLMLERPENVTPWILSESLYDGRLVGPLVPFASVLLNACLAKSGHAPAAISHNFSGDCPRSTFHSALRSIYDGLSLSMALAETGAFDDASKTLRGAMSLACPDALYSPFFELCPTGWAMLDKASREEPGYQSFVSAIRKYGRRLDGARNQAKNDADIFTKREMEIVSLLQSGLKNKEIADTLHISENTVKAFLKKIFLKKGIASRKCLAKGKHP